MNKQQIQEYREKINDPKYINNAINALAGLIVDELYTPRIKVKKMKKCISCGVEKEVNNFPNKRDKLNGHSFCKECMAKRTKEYKKNLP